MYRDPVGGTILNRRRVVQGLGGVLAVAVPGLAPRPAFPATPSYLTFGLPSGEYDTAVHDALPGKKPLIKLAYRPPNYETPVSYFTSPITANDAFFVRYHLADIPERIDLPSWRLRVGGEAAANPFELTMADLENGFEQVEITAVCQYSGNIVASPTRTWLACSGGSGRWAMPCGEGFGSRMFWPRRGCAKRRSRSC
jgi:DMSO/TMAO reductase YedYZ molybdopterin-dependent catalytic subunit